MIKRYLCSHKNSHSMIYNYLIYIALSLMCGACSSGNPGGKTSLVIGSYAGTDTTSVYICDFDTASCHAFVRHAIHGLTNPSFVIPISGGKGFLAVNECAAPHAALSLIKRNEDSGDYLTVFNRPIGADGPCHVAVDPSERFAVTANYSGSSIAIMPLFTDSIGEPQILHYTGSGAHPERQAVPHPHFIAFTPDKRLMLVTDLGTDRIYTYPLLPTASPQLVDTTAIRVIDMPAGAGPRHIEFNATGSHAYVINEIGGSVTLLDYNADSLNFTLRQTITVDRVGAQGSGDIHLSPDGNYLYASNRLMDDGVAVLKVNPTDGTLTPAGYINTGAHPRAFAISPDGRWLLLAARDTDEVEIYRIQNSTGMLVDTGKRISCQKPVSVKFF